VAKEETCRSQYKSSKTIMGPTLPQAIHEDWHGNCWSQIQNKKISLPRTTASRAREGHNHGSNITALHDMETCRINEHDHGKKVSMRTPLQQRNTTNLKTLGVGTEQRKGSEKTKP
jgi:hypothetical protein